MPVEILPLASQFSDGDSLRHPTNKDYKHNDAHFLEKVAERWAKDLGLRPGVTYRLERLPHGYGGYEKARGAGGGDSKHVDRYVYGHEKGQFRSINEFYPHFKWLMENDGTEVCNCKPCSGVGKGARKRASGAGRVSVGIGSQGVGSGYFPDSTAELPGRGRPRSGLDGLLQSRSPHEHPVPQQRRKQVDEDGTPDALRGLLDQLKANGPEGKVNESLVESMSPDWRTGHAMLFALLKEWRSLPSYMPRQGELVLFVRNLSPKETLGWDQAARTWRIVDTSSNAWSERPKWEAGVVTQMPTEPIIDEDLARVPKDKQHSVINSGFRIEPLPQPNSVNKTYTKQHKYVPLHTIRPLCLWKEAVNGLDEHAWHPTIRHALTISSSMCLIGRYQFKGTWPEATVFAQGLFLGPELVMVGDAVRLLPRLGEKEVVTDIMVITAIKFRIVNLDEAGDDDWDNGQPYTTCIHISGRVFTSEPNKSFNGIRKVPAPVESNDLPPALRDVGSWYHVIDPKKAKLRIEVPYQRVLGRSYEGSALKAWFTSPPDIAPPSSFQAVNSTKLSSPATLSRTQLLSTGLKGLTQGREYSTANDIRINASHTGGGKTWFWADSRIEQLDLTEVNGKIVPMRDLKEQDRRSRRQMMEDWRKALKALDGRGGGLAEYHAALKQREEVQARRGSALGASASGLAASSAQAMGAETSGMEALTAAEDLGADYEDMDAVAGSGEDGGDDVTEIDQLVGMQPLESDGDEEGSGMDVDARDALAAFKGTPVPAPRNVSNGGSRDVIVLDDDDGEEGSDED